jgi:Fur family ferric uptake transcriptional regulator
MASPRHARWDEHVRDELRRSGARAGGARDAVIAHLAAQDCCLSAQEVFDELRAGGRAVGLASVYRVLDQLAEMGLVHRIDLGHGVARFEPAHPGGHHHHHLVCGECGTIETFDDRRLEQAVSRVAGSRGYTLEGHDVVLHGTCNECRNHTSGRRTAR